MSQPATQQSADAIAYPHERRTVVSLAGIYLLRLLGMYMVLPVLGLHAAQLPGATPLLTGLSVGAYGLAQSALQIPFGVWSDRFGRRRVIAVGLLIFAGGSVLAAMAPNVAWLVVGRVMQGAGGISAAVVALLADATRPVFRARAMGILGASVGIAFAIGMIAGPGLAARFGVPFLFWLTAGLSVLAALWVITGVPRPPRHVHDASVEWTPGHLMEVIKDPGMLRVDLGAFFLHSQVTAMFVVGPRLLTNHLPQEEHGVVYLVLVPIGLVFMGLTAYFGDRRGLLKQSVLVGVACVAASAFFLVGGWDNFYGVAAAMGFTILAVATAEPAAPSIVTHLANDSARGTAAGLYHMCQFMGSFFGGLVGGYMLDRPEELGVLLIMGSLTWFALASGLPDLGPGGVRRD
ncbi:MFS transporter [bacterium]|nr:MAG: MFS transporter [bacterium]